VRIAGLVLPAVPTRAPLAAAPADLERVAAALDVTRGHGPQPRPQGPGMDVRGPHHPLRVHAGDGPRQRPPGWLCRPPPRREGPATDPLLREWIEGGNHGTNGTNADRRAHGRRARGP